MHLESNQNSGFTLIEILLSIAIIAAITGFGLPVYRAVMVRNDLDIGATILVQTARRAQILSQASLGDSNWGISIQSGKITLFKGTSFLARDITYDEVYDLSTSLTPTGTTEIVYTKFTGVPQTTGNITLTSNTNETKTITINGKGTVNF